MVQRLEDKQKGIPNSGLVSSPRVMRFGMNKLAEMGFGELRRALTADWRQTLWQRGEREDAKMQSFHFNVLFHKSRAMPKHGRRIAIRKRNPPAQDLRSSVFGCLANNCDCMGQGTEQTKNRKAMTRGQGAEK